MIRCATLRHRVDRHANARNRRGRQALAPSAADFPTAEIRAHQSAPARTASRHEAAHLRFDGDGVVRVPGAFACERQGQGWLPAPSSPLVLSPA